VRVNKALGRDDRHMMLARLSVECLSHDEVESFHTQAALNLADNIVLVSRYCRLAVPEVKIVHHHPIEHLLELQYALMYERSKSVRA
jgi:hypothetical protein